MTPDDLARLVDDYRAGIEAELQLLHQLQTVARTQHDVTRTGDYEAFGTVAGRRDEIMRSLVMIEEGLRAVRQTLGEHRAVVSRIEGFEDVAALHREAGRLVNTILATDQASMSALADAEMARRSALASLERGEATLAAYRRVLTPPVANATLVDRRG
ncbi:MAG: hypothetical protein R2752_06065 [Vicinamibacterales bacterium]